MNCQRRGVSRVAAAILVVAVVLIGAIALANVLSQGSSFTTSSPLVSYSADAYSIETAALLNSFSSSTGIPVAPVKSGGSFADASQIAAGAPDDVFVSASLSATGPRYLKSQSANWSIGFASDQMVIAYTNASSASATVVRGLGAATSNRTSDWNVFFASLTAGGVKVGIADPVADPAGLRGWLVLEAAGFLYDGGDQSGFTTRLLHSGGNVTGAHAAALIAPLESGQIQFLFIYRSAAMSNHLRFIQLDRHANLGDPSQASFYSRFSYQDAAGVTEGAPILICVTVPGGSASAGAALKFVEYVVRNAGALSAYGLQPTVPAELYSDGHAPQPITDLVSQGLVVQAGSLR